MYIYNDAVHIATCNFASTVYADLHIFFTFLHLLLLLLLLLLLMHLQSTFVTLGL